MSGADERRWLPASDRPALLEALKEGCGIQGIVCDGTVVGLLLSAPSVASGAVGRDVVPEAGAPEEQTERTEWHVHAFPSPVPVAVLRGIRFVHQEVFGEPFDPWFGHLDRTEGARCWVVVEADRVVGYKWGAPRGPREFHSHVGAVDPDWRRRGIGRALLRAQQRWAAGRYRRLSTATFNRFASMLRLNLVEGYRVEGVVDRGGRPMLLLAMDSSSPGVS